MNDIAGTDYDWGVYNKISNGGNQAGLWRTLTKDEWEYLIHDRAQAIHLVGTGKVNGVRGIILLPDGWETPSSVIFKENFDFSIASNSNALCELISVGDNVYSLAEWTIMESYGAVFLPASGYRNMTKVKNVGRSWRYWSSSVSDKDYAYSPCFDDSIFDAGGGGTPLYPTDYSYRYQGLPVRLVQDVK